MYAQMIGLWTYRHRVGQIVFVESVQAYIFASPLM